MILSRFELSWCNLGNFWLEFKSKELAVEYAKKNNIDFEVIEPKERKIIKKSYADNFTK